MQSPFRICRSGLGATSRLVIAFVFLACVQSAIAGDTTVKQIYNTQGSVGNISLGMKFSALEKQDSRRLKSIADVLRESKAAYRYTFPNGHSVIIGVDLNGAVSEIRITDPYFLTEKNIRVSDMFSKVREAYPDYACNHGDGYLVLVNYEINRAFEFSTDELSSQWLNSRSQDCSVPSTQRLEYISISTPR